MKIYRLLTDLIFIIHILVVLIVLFGWAFPVLKLIYLLVLIVSLMATLFLNACPLSKWEFDLRKKLDPSLNYDYTFLTYYFYKLGLRKIPSKVIKYSPLVFLSGSITIFIIQR